MCCPSLLPSQFLLTFSARRQVLLRLGGSLATRTSVLRDGLLRPPLFLCLWYRATRRCLLCYVTVELGSVYCSSSVVKELFHQEVSLNPSPAIRQPSTVTAPSVKRTLTAGSYLDKLPSAGHGGPRLPSDSMGRPSVIVSPFLSTLISAIFSAASHVWGSLATLQIGAAKASEAHVGSSRLAR